MSLCSSTVQVLCKSSQPMDREDSLFSRAEDHIAHLVSQPSQKWDLWKIVGILVAH